MAAEQQVPEASRDHYTQPPDNASLSLIPASSFFPLSSCSQQVRSAHLQKGRDLPLTQPVVKVSGTLSAFTHEEGKEDLLSLESEDEEMINCELLLGQEDEIVLEEGDERERAGNESLESKDRNGENEQQNEDEQVKNESDALEIEIQLIGNENEDNHDGNENDQNGNEDEQNGNERNEINCNEQLPQNEDNHQSETLQYQNENTGNEKEIVQQNEKEEDDHREIEQEDNSKPRDISSLTLDTLASSPLALLATSNNNDPSLFSFDHLIVPLSKAQLLCTLNKDTSSKVEYLQSLSFSTPPQWKCDTDNSPPQKRPKISHVHPPLPPPVEEEVVDDGKATLLQALPSQEARESIEFVSSAVHCSSHEDNDNDDDDEDSTTCFVVPDEPLLLADDEDAITFHSDSVKTYSDVATMTANEELPKRRLVPSPLMTKSVLKRGKEISNRIVFT